MINDSLGTSLYFAYKNAGPTPGMIIPAFLLNSVAIPGVVANLFVVFVTIATKSLHGSANFLLALICLGEAVHQSGHAIFLGIAVSGVNFIEFQQAAWLQAHMFVGSDASIFGMTLAAGDRLLAILSPSRHLKLNKTLYLGACSIICALYGIYWAYYIVDYAKGQQGVPVTGNLADLLVGVPGVKFFYITAILNGISIFCYFLVWLLTKQKNGVTQKTNARLLKSLLLIISINIGGYLLSLAFFELLNLLFQYIDYIWIWRLGFISGILLNLAAACNAVVLYFTSTEYRKAFLLHLRKIAAFLLRKNLENQSSTIRVRYIGSQQLHPSQQQGKTEIENNEIITNRIL